MLTGKLNSKSDRQSFAGVNAGLSGKFSKVSALLLISAVLVVLFTGSAFAGSTFSNVWYQSGEDWRVSDGYEDVKGSWLCDDAVKANGKDVWYLINNAGNMYASGLVMDNNGNYYSLETNHNGYYGMLRNRPGVYDGIYLDIETDHNGRYGAIKNAEAIEALKAKYGVTKLDFANNRLVYTSNITADGASDTSDTSDADEDFDGYSSQYSFESSSYEDEYDGDEYGELIGDQEALEYTARLAANAKRAEALAAQGYTNLYSDEQIEEIKAAEQDFVNNYITSDMTDFEKEMEIVKYLCDNVTYADEAKGTDFFDDGYAETHYEYGALVGGRAVCGGYSHGFYVLGRAAGLNVNIIHGTANGGNHAWNMICLDDGWYWVDVTWADCTGDMLSYINKTGSFADHTPQQVHAGQKNMTATGSRYGTQMVAEYFGY